MSSPPPPTKFFAPERFGRKFKVKRIVKTASNANRIEPAAASVVSAQDPNPAALSSVLELQPSSSGTQAPALNRTLPFRALSPEPRATLSHSQPQLRDCPTFEISGQDFPIKRIAKAGERKWIICPWDIAIPEMPDFEVLPSTKIDGRLGMHDPMQYPQIGTHLRSLEHVVEPHYPWVEAPRPRHHDLNGDLVHYSIQPKDWQLLPNSTTHGHLVTSVRNLFLTAFENIYRSIGPFMAIAKNQWMLPFNTLLKTRAAFNQLLDFATTWDDLVELVAHVQRGISLLRAFLACRVDIMCSHPSQGHRRANMQQRMGIFTEDQIYALELYHFGMPVYLVIYGPLPDKVDLEKVERLKTAAERGIEMRDLNRGVRIVESQMQVDESSASLPGGGLPHAIVHVPGEQVVQAATSSSSSTRTSAHKAPPTHLSRSKPYHRGESSRKGVANATPKKEKYKGDGPSKGLKMPEGAPAGYVPRHWQLFPHGDQPDVVQAHHPTEVPYLSGIVPGLLNLTIARTVELADPAKLGDQVPQRYFAGKQLHRVPPAHIMFTFNGPEHKAMFFTTWLTMRNSWFWRLSREPHKQNPGHPSQMWRNILDDKYRPHPHWKPQVPPPVPTSPPLSDHNPTSARIDAPTSPPLALSMEASLHQSTSSLSMRDHYMDVDSDSDSDSDDDVPRAEIIHTFRSPGQLEGELPLRSEDERDAIQPQNWYDLPRGTKRYWIQDDHFEMREIGRNRREDHLAGQSARECWDFTHNWVIYLVNLGEKWTEGERLLVPMKWMNIRKRNGQPTYSDPTSVRIWLARPRPTSKKVIAAVLPLQPPTSPQIAATVSCDAMQIDEIDHVDEAEDEHSGSLVMRAKDLNPEPVLGLATVLSKAEDDALSAMIQNKAVWDPVFGTEPSMIVVNPSTVCFGRHRFSPNELVRPEVQGYIVWELIEVAFRYQLCDMDERILTARGVWTKEKATERNKLWWNCWGDEDGVLPAEGSRLPLTHADWKVRVPTLRALQTLVKEWPRCAPEAARTELQPVVDSDEFKQKFLHVEREVWRLYCQSYVDYFGRVPTLPCIRPANPFSLSP